jgi:hypothetical protein
VIAAADRLNVSSAPVISIRPKIGEITCRNILGIETLQRISIWDIAVDGAFRCVIRIIERANYTPSGNTRIGTKQCRSSRRPLLMGDIKFRFCRRPPQHRCKPRNVVFGFHVKSTGLNLWIISVPTVDTIPTLFLGAELAKATV